MFLLLIYTWFYFNTISIHNNIVFLEHTVLNVLFMYQTLIQILQTDWVESSTQSNLVIQNSCSTYYPVFCHPSCTRVLYQLSILIIIYFILGVKSGSSTLLLAMSDNFRPPSHQSILCILHFHHSLLNGLYLKYALCFWCTYHYYPYTQNTYYTI